MTVFIVVYDCSDWGTAVWQYKGCFTTRKEAEEYIEREAVEDTTSSFDGRLLFEIREETV